MEHVENHYATAFRGLQNGCNKYVFGIFQNLHENLLNSSFKLPYIIDYEIMKKKYRCNMHQCFSCLRSKKNIHCKCDDPTAIQRVHLNFSVLFSVYFASFCHIYSVKSVQKIVMLETKT